jgi:hypothetical protein
MSDAVALLVVVVATEKVLVKGLPNTACFKDEYWLQASRKN